MESSAIKNLADPCRYTHARHDPAHCLIPGLFRALKRGDRQRLKLNVTGRYGDVALEIKGPEPLGADDLRVLQGLVAMAAPLEAPQMLGSSQNQTHADLQTNLQLEGSAQVASCLVVNITYYQLARTIGMNPKGGRTNATIRGSLDRLWGVSIYATLKNVRTGYRVLSKYRTTDNQICVALNPRISMAILGKLSGFTGSHTRIDMREVQKIKLESTRLVHQYLSALLAPGEPRQISAHTLSRHIWFDPANSPDAERKRSFYLEKSLKELESLRWKCSCTTNGRRTKTELTHRVYEIQRPTIAQSNAAAVSKFQTCH